MTPDDLRSWRSRLGLSLTQAGDALGITRRAYMRYEAGDREISETVARLARAVESLTRLGRLNELEPPAAHAP